MGLARTGATSGNGSGDIFLAFSTANESVASAEREIHVNMLSNNRISALFSATVDATEEAIVNALVAAETMTGRDGRKVEALPHDRLRDLLKKYGLGNPSLYDSNGLFRGGRALDRCGRRGGLGSSRPMRRWTPESQRPRRASQGPAAATP